MAVRRDAERGPTWYENDAKYEAIGEAEIPKYNPEWEGELEEMNRGKVGRPYKYPHSMMASIAMAKIMWGNSYRRCRGKLKRCWPGKGMPVFSTIWKRIGPSMPRFERDPAFRPEPGSAVRLVVDSTGIKNSNRGEWISVKWNVKRGFFKMHILVDIDTLRILEFCLTDMNGGDAAQLPGLVGGLLKEYAGEGAPLPDPVAELVVDQAREGGTGRPDRSQTLMDRWLPGGDGAGGESGDWESGDGAGGDEYEGDAGLLRIHRALEERGIHVKLWGDGAYDARYVFSLLKSLGIAPLVRVRIDSGTRSRGVNRARSRAVLDQLGGRGGCTSQELARMTKSERQANQKDWRKRVEFGLRWLVEIVISAFKRVFGESVRALKPHTAYVEIATKIAAYNYTLDVGDRAVWAAREACAAA